MTSAPTLAASLRPAVLASPAPVALVDDDGLVLAASASFPLAGRSRFDPLDADLARVPLAGCALLVPAGLTESRHALEALAVEARRRAAQSRRAHDALAAALRQLETDLAAGGAQVLQTLAATFAHEVNSPLAALGANVEFARGALAEGRPSEAREALADVAEGLALLNRMGAQLRRVSARGQRYQVIELRRLLAVLDPAAPAAEEGSVLLGEPDAVLPAFEALARTVSGARVTRVGVGAEGFVLGLSCAGVAVPPALAALGVTQESAAQGCRLRIPFRLVQQ